MDFYWREDIIIKTNFIFYILHSRFQINLSSRVIQYPETSAIYPNLNPPQKKNQSHHTSSKPFQSNSSQKKKSFLTTHHNKLDFPEEHSKKIHPSTIDSRNLPL